MEKNRCFLCGGKVSKGVCTECGMPQRQQAEDYDLNKSECDDKPLTHVHEDKPQAIVHGDSSEQKKQIDEKMILTDQQRGEAAWQQAKKSGALRQVLLNVIPVILVFVVAFGIFPVYARWHNAKVDAKYHDSTEETESEQNNPVFVVDDIEYNNCMYSMPEEGESFIKSLSAGYYKVGYDIPEGTYFVTVASGAGSISIADENNGIYISELLDHDCDSESEYHQIDNLRLYQGAEMFIDGGLSLTFSAINAQTDKMVDKVSNELTEMVSVDEEALMAGRDFPAGTYDISCLDGICVVNIYMDDGIYSDDDDFEEYYGGFTYYDKLDDVTHHEQAASFLLQPWDDTSENESMKDYAYSIYNVKLEDGMYIYADGERLVLTPSSLVIP